MLFHSKQSKNFSTQKCNGQPLRSQQLQQICLLLAPWPSRQSLSLSFPGNKLSDSAHVQITKMKIKRKLQNNFMKRQSVMSRCCRTSSSWNPPSGLQIEWVKAYKRGTMIFKNMIIGALTQTHYARAHTHKLTQTMHKICNEYPQENIHKDTARMTALSTTLLASTDV